MNLNRIKILLVCSIVGLVGLVGQGCRTANTYSRKESTAEKNVVEDKRVSWDPLLGIRAQVIEIIESLETDGYSKVQVEVRNNAFWRKKFEYKFEWFDAKGNLITSSADAYQVREILGRERLYITGTAPTTSAKDFRLKIIRTRR